ncbi:hypothetical protein OL548_23570 [Lysinibacillus sp. MHQ-1]|nr:hypothetical protein OL548_23570 [Lysinibacillus sp. MHQ-1]
MELDKATMFLKFTEKNGNSIMRGHVGLEQNKTVTNWHYHLKYDGFEYHHEQTLLRHNSLPAWGDSD